MRGYRDAEWEVGSPSSAGWSFSLEFILTISAFPLEEPPRVFFQPDGSVDKTSRDILGTASDRVHSRVVARMKKTSGIFAIAIIRPDLSDLACMLWINSVDLVFPYKSG